MLLSRLVFCVRRVCIVVGSVCCCVLLCLLLCCCFCVCECCGCSLLFTDSALCVFVFLLCVRLCVLYVLLVLLFVECLVVCVSFVCGGDVVGVGCCCVCAVSCLYSLILICLYCL